MLFINLNGPSIGEAHENVTVSDAFDETLNYYVDTKGKNISSDLDGWEAVLALDEAGQDLSDGWILPNWENESLVGKIIGLNAAGLDPEDYNSSNYVEELVSKQTDQGDFQSPSVLADILTMLALEVFANDYEDYSLDNAINYLFSEQDSETGRVVDIDTTGMFIKVKVGLNSSIVFSRSSGSKLTEL